MPHRQAERERYLIYMVAALVILAGFLIAYQFVQPAPPKHIRIATGSAGNAYHRFALAYKTTLAKEGIELEVLETAGTQDNLQRLRNGEVELAFVQGGVANPADYPQLQSLGSLFWEPLWIFTQRSQAVDRLTQLKGKRLAIGAEGSGTRAFAELILADNGVTHDNSHLIDLSGEAARHALLINQIDALFMVTNPASQNLRSLLLQPELKAISLSRAEAYPRRYPFLTALTLPEGVLDLALNYPSSATKLISPAATLAVNENFHPALTALILQAASQQHGASSLLTEAGRFPSANGIDFPLNEDAERFYKRGTPFLQRYLPFWAANLIDRLVVMLIPLVTLMIPLFKILPPTYRWRVRSRIYRWYDELRELDFKVAAVKSPSELEKLLAELNEIEADVMQVTVPQSYADTQYNLRLHLRLIRERLDQQRSRLSS